MGGTDRVNLCRCRIHSRNRSCCKESCAYGGATLPAAVVVPVVGLRVIEKRLERSYYDEIDETGA